MPFEVQVERLMDVGGVPAEERDAFRARFQDPAASYKWAESFEPDSEDDFNQVVAMFVRAHKAGSTGPDDTRPPDEVIFGQMVRERHAMLRRGADYPPAHPLFDVIELSNFLGFKHTDEMPDPDSLSYRFRDGYGEPLPE